MLKELFQKKEPKPEEIKRAVAVINPNNVPQGAVSEAQKSEVTSEQSQQEVKVINLIVSSEALEDGTFRYMLISNKVYSIGTLDINQ